MWIRQDEAGRFDNEAQSTSEYTSCSNRVHTYAYWMRRRCNIRLLSLQSPTLQSHAVTAIVINRIILVKTSNSWLLNSP